MTVKRSPNEEARPVALVTGASTGIGEGFARRLGRDGYDLVLVAKTGEEDLLAKLSKELSQEHGISTEYLAADFSKPEDVTKVVEKIERTPNLAILVNNAGFGGPGVFHEKDLDIQLDMIRVNVIAGVRLAHAAIPLMLAAKEKTPIPGSYGIYSIINVSSVASYILYTPNLVYRSTKVFLRGFSESLAFELRGSGIRVQALCPGLTRTAMYAKTGYGDDHPIFTKRKFMSAAQVVDCSIRCLKKNRVVCIPGWHNRLFAIIFSLMPRKMFYWGYGIFQKGGGKYVRGWEESE